MVQEPRDTDSIYTDLKNRLTGKIQGLTNFTRNSFNWVWTRAFSQEFRDFEVQKLAIQLSGWVDYAGGDVTEDDLRDLGIEDSVSPEELNQYLDDIDLNNLVNIVNIERDEGSKSVATKEVTENEEHTYDTGSTNHPKYELDETLMENFDSDNGIIEVTGIVNGSDFTFEKDVHFKEGTVGNQARKNAIDWSPAISNNRETPDSGTVFEVTYESAGNRLLVSVSDDGAVIPEGTGFGTLPDNNGEYLRYESTREFTPKTGADNVYVEAEAEEVGSEYNVGSGSIQYLPNPPIRVTGVEQPEATFGGVDEESNDELRERAKNAIVESSGGGTVGGVEGYILENTDASFVVVDEFYDGENSSQLSGISFDGVPYADVVIEGGTTSEIQTAIDESHPSGVKHRLIRPTRYGVRVNATLQGTDIDTDLTEDRITDYVSGRGIGENIYRDQLIKNIMNSDDDIINLSDLRVTLWESSDNQYGEQHTFESGTLEYPLNTVDAENGLDNRDDFDNSEPGIVEVNYIDGNGDIQQLTEGTDYEEDTDGSGNPVITFDINDDSSAEGTTPPNGNKFFVRYAIREDMLISDREKVTIESISLTTEEL